MKTLTAEAFKEQLKTEHVVANTIVKEPVTIDFRDTGSFTGDFTIRNCDLKSLRISDNQFDSLTIRRGTIKELIFQTNAQIKTVMLNKCDINILTTTETLIEDFSYVAGSIKTVFNGQYANLAKFSLSGSLKSVSLISPSCGTVDLSNIQADEVSMISLQPGILGCKNLICKKLYINYGLSPFEKVTLENVSAKDFEIVSEGVRSLKLAGNTKYLSMGTTLTP